jgi:dTDP-4-dehydrorhamnose reductase
MARFIRVFHFRLTPSLAFGTGLTRSDPPRILKLDLSDFAALEKLIDELAPTVIVHRYALRLGGGLIQSAVEKRFEVFADPTKADQVYRLNVQVPEFLGNITRAKGIFLIYISTGYPFESFEIDVQITSLMARTHLIIPRARQSAVLFHCCG